MFFPWAHRGPEPAMGVGANEETTGSGAGSREAGALACVLPELPTPRSRLLFSVTAGGGFSALMTSMTWHDSAPSLGFSLPICPYEVGLDRSQTLAFQTVIKYISLVVSHPVCGGFVWWS